VLHNNTGVVPLKGLAGYAYDSRVKLHGAAVVCGDATRGIMFEGPGVEMMGEDWLHSC
jgi:hypothetical protein